jgi:hypothetical protein
MVLPRPERQTRAVSKPLHVVSVWARAGPEFALMVMGPWGEERAPDRGTLQLAGSNLRCDRDFRHARVDEPDDLRMVSRRV